MTSVFQVDQTLMDVLVIGSIANRLYEESFRRWRASGLKSGTSFDRRGAIAAVALTLLIIPVTL